MNACQYCRTYMQQSLTGGCQVCSQRNQHQNYQLQYNPPQYQGGLGQSGMINYDPYSTVLNQILASLLRIEEKLNEKKED